MMRKTSKLKRAKSELGENYCRKKKTTASLWKRYLGSSSQCWRLLPSKLTQANAYASCPVLSWAHLHTNVHGHN